MEWIKIRYLMVKYIRLYGIFTSFLIILGFIQLVVSGEDLGEFLNKRNDLVPVLLIFFLLPALIQFRGEYIEDNLERKWRKKLNELKNKGVISEEKFAEENKKIRRWY
jgi:hypothetical protein